MPGEARIDLAVINGVFMALKSRAKVILLIDYHHNKKSTTKYLILSQ